MSQEQSHSQSGNTNAMGTHVGSSHVESTHVMGSSHGSSHVQSMIRYIESLPDEISILDEVKSYQFWKAVRTEFLATFLLIIFGCGSITGPYSSPHQFPANQTANSNQIFQSNLIVFELKVSLVFGLIIATLVQCMGQVSGAHMNPAVTLSLFVTRRLTLFRFSMYLFAQSFGSIFACLILFLLKPSSLSSSEPTSSLGFIQPSNQINLSQAFGYEFLSTFIIVLTHLANCDRAKTDAGFKSLSIGFSYSVAHLFAVRKIT